VASEEGCESGRIGTLGKRVWGNPPWVRIPLPPRRRAEERGCTRTAPAPPGFHLVEGFDTGARCSCRRYRRLVDPLPAGPGDQTFPDDATSSDEIAMQVALEEARTAGDAGEVPVGAVVVLDGRVIARAGNERERRADPTAHAEVLALRAAAEAVGAWRLGGATLVVTLEPCVMCAGALLAARVDRVVFGAPNADAGSCGTLYNVCSDPRLNHEVVVTPGVLAEEAAELLRSFFVAQRDLSRPDGGPESPW
jgi:tRNA(adenine34) deaminase